MSSRGYQDIGSDPIYYIFIGIVNFFGGWQAFLGLFGVSSNVAENWAWILVAGVIGLMLFALDHAFKIDRHDWYRSHDTLYVRQPDGAIEVHEIAGKCPVGGCPGTLHLREPTPNKEGVRLAGICDRWGERHMFEFNDETYQGSRIERLTPIERPK